MYQALINKYLDGLTEDSVLGALKEHIKQCSVCREEFETFGKIQNIVKEVLCPRTVPGEARNRILSQLLPMPSLAFGRNKLGRSSRRWVPAFSYGLLVLGMLIGFGVAQIITIGQPIPKGARQAPIRISSLEGTVLVKHHGSDIWKELNQSSNLYLGDLFQCPARSTITFSLKDESKIILDPNSILSIQSRGERIEFDLAYGTMKVALDSPHSPLTIITPEGRVEALGTEFTVSVG
jgi:hypothetical protein